MIRKRGQRPTLTALKHNTTTMKIPENLDPKLVKPLEKFKEKWFKMSTEQQFQAAVNIIKGLPKDGKR